MKNVFALTMLAATAVSANILSRQEPGGEDEAALEQCLTNQCSDMYQTVEDKCYSIIGGIDSDTDLGQQQAIQFYGCICDEFRNASDDCKTCTKNAGKWVLSVVLSR